MDNEIILLKDCFYVSFLKKKEVQAVEYEYKHSNYI